MFLGHQHMFLSFWPRNIYLFPVVMSLLESFGNKSCFIYVNRSISFPLNLIDPLAINKIMVRIRGNKIPCLVTN
jgi:hypothetical protein